MTRHLLRCSALAFATLSSCCLEPAFAAAGESSPAAGEAASAATSAAAASAPAAAAGNAEQHDQCSSPEVFKRVWEAARLNKAEEDVVRGGATTQGGEILSNILGVGGAFRLAALGAGVSAHKKIADAIAVDPCGEKAIEAFPAAYQVAYKAYRKKAATE